MIMGANQQNGLTRRAALLGMGALCACSTTTNEPGTSLTPVAGRSGGTPDSELTKNATQLQKSMIDASKFGLTGIAGQYVLGDDEGLGVGVGTIGGIIPVLIITASYSSQVAKLPENVQREKLVSDIKQTNDEAEAVIKSMKSVVRREETKFAAAKKSGSNEAAKQAAADLATNLEILENSQVALTNRGETIIPLVDEKVRRGGDAVLGAERNKFEENKQEIEVLAQATRESPALLTVGL